LFIEFCEDFDMHPIFEAFQTVDGERKLILPYQCNDVRGRKFAVICLIVSTIKKTQNGFDN
jgi:hypothetical protein